MAYTARSFIKGLLISMVKQTVRFGLLLSALIVSQWCVAQTSGGDTQKYHLMPLSSQSSSASIYDEAIQKLEQRRSVYPDDYEASLLIGLLKFKSGQTQEAIEEMDALTLKAPKFHLAYLIQGDMLLSNAQTVTDFGAVPLLPGLKQHKEEIDRLNLLKNEAEARLTAFLDTLPNGRLPRELLQIDKSVKNAILVDKSAHRLYVYALNEATGRPELVRDYYVSTGKLNGNKRVVGDLKTPEGVYFITSHIPQKRLPAKYGISAYPMNYPNELDRKLGKTGYGIWLHGTDPVYYSRPPLDSEGCVVLPNIDLSNVSQFLNPGRTPVIVAENVTWLEPSKWEQLSVEVEAAIHAWRDDWGSGDVDAYLGHYATEFWSGGYNRDSWSKRKRRIAQSKTYQSIGIDKLSLFTYPKSATDGREIIVANFRQDYRSNNFSNAMDKRLYLTREDGQWRVLYEGAQ